MTPQREARVGVVLKWHHDPTRPVYCEGHNMGKRVTTIMTNVFKKHISRGEMSFKKRIAEKMNTCYSIRSTVLHTLYVSERVCSDVA